jgi:hypothetical protein
MYGDESGTKSPNCRDMLSQIMLNSDHSARLIYGKNLDCLRKALELVSPKNEIMLWPLLGIEKTWKNA